MTTFLRLLSKVPCHPNDNFMSQARLYTGLLYFREIYRWWTDARALQGIGRAPLEARLDHPSRGALMTYVLESFQPSSLGNLPTTRCLALRVPFVDTYRFARRRRIFRYSLLPVRHEEPTKVVFDGA